MTKYTLLLILFTASTYVFAQNSNIQKTEAELRHAESLDKLKRSKPTATIVDIEQKRIEQEKLTCSTCPLKKVNQTYDFVPEEKSLAALREDSSQVHGMYIAAYNSTNPDKAELNKLRMTLELIQRKIRKKESALLKTQKNK